MYFLAEKWGQRPTEILDMPSDEISMAMAFYQMQNREHVRVSVEHEDQQRMRRKLADEQHAAEAVRGMNQ